MRWRLPLAFESRDRIVARNELCRDLAAARFELHELALHALQRLLERSQRGAPRFDRKRHLVRVVARSRARSCAFPRVLRATHAARCRDSAGAARARSSARSPLRAGRALRAPDRDRRDPPLELCQARSSTRPMRSRAPSMRPRWLCNWPAISARRACARYRPRAERRRVPARRRYAARLPHVGGFDVPGDLAFESRRMCSSARGSRVRAR